MRLIGLNHEDRRGAFREQGFGQALLGAACSVLLLALPLWALESVNDIAVDAVVHEHTRDPARPGWQGPRAGTPGDAARNLAADGWEGVHRESVVANDRDDEDADD